MATRYPAPASLLFVPGSMPERFDKALSAGADVVCLDLEDAVAPEAKAAAREAVLAFAGQQPRPGRLCIRINQLGSVYGMEDTLALARAARRANFIMLPKVATARDAELLLDVFDPHPPTVIALIESPQGVEAAFEIAHSPAVAMLMFGGFDYAAATGSDQTWNTLLAARSRLVAAGAAAGKPVIDSPYARLDDVAGAADENRRASAIGFAGKAAIHPKMVPDINTAFTPSEQEIVDARAIVAAFDASGGAVARIGGKLVELPVVLRMRRLIDRADERRAG